MWPAGLTCTAGHSLMCLAQAAAAATGCWRHIFLELYQLVEVDLVVALHQSRPSSVTGREVDHITVVSYVHRIYCLTRLVTWGGRRRFRDLMDAVKVWAWWGSRS